MTHERLNSRVIKRIDVGESERHLQPQAQCPRCETWADVDEDMILGQVSMICDCGWHGYIDGRKA